MGYKHGRTAADRLWERIDRSQSGCWEWPGATNVKGYGVIRSMVGYQVTTHATHRVAWESEVGPIPAGMFVCHVCDNPRCCRPDHLYLGTSADNTRDREQRGLNGMAKLDWTKVAEIRARRESGDLLARIAADYGVSISQVSWICLGKIWVTHPETP